MLCKALLLMALAPTALGATPLAVFDDTVKTTSENFYDPKMRGVDWGKLTTERRKALELSVGKDKGAALSQEAEDARLKEALNSLLGELHTSHTSFLSSADQEYWALQSIFSGDIAGHRLRQIGAWFERRGNKWFVRNVFKGSPAGAAGLMRGDEIVSVDGSPLKPVQSFTSQRPSVKVGVKYKRLPWEEPKTVDVSTVVESFQESMLRGMQQSRQLYSYKGRNIGYVWLPTGTHESFRKELASAAADFEIKADAMILDLRDGFGGADQAFLGPFFETMPKGGLEEKPGQPKPAVVKPAYTKPLVVLTNGGTRSGKEWLAWFMKRHLRATLVGDATAGAFLSARLFDIVPRRYALYLAVADASSTLGVKLEGQGVEPDVPVEAPLMYAAGVDPQMDRALATALEKIDTKRK